MKKKELEKCKELEREILREKGFADSEFVVAEEPLGGEAFLHYVRIQKTPATADNILLMAHGYMGSNIGFFKLYRALAEHFHIISVDLPGQGLSSSLKDTPTSAQAWVDYFVSSLQRFCDRLALARVNVCGHSMGAFVLTHFAQRNPARVADVFLLSPGGVNRENPQFLQRKEEFMQSRGAFMRCLGRKVSSKIFKDKCAPLSIWFFGWFRSSFAKMIYGGKRLGLDEREQKCFIPLYKSIYNSVPSSDKCLGYLFNEGPMSDRPLMPIFEALHAKMNFFLLYGAFDWMDHRFTREQVERKELEVDIAFVDKCDHQIVFQNPEGAAHLILSKRREWRLLEENARNKAKAEGRVQAEPGSASRPPTEF